MTSSPRSKSQSRAQPYSGAKRRRSLRSIFAAKKPIAIEVMEVSGNRVMTRSKLYRRLTTPNVPSITTRSQPSWQICLLSACFSSADFRPSLGPEPARCTKADFLCRDKPGLPESSLGRSQRSLCIPQRPASDFCSQSSCSSQPSSGKRNHSQVFICTFKVNCRYVLYNIFLAESLP